MTQEEAVNIIIKDGKLNTNKISDGYHTFEELYEHRIALFIALLDHYRTARLEQFHEGWDHNRPGWVSPVWRSKKHSDGSEWDGWFILGLFKDKGQQITYHLPISKWNDCYFADELEMAPEWDGHTSADVLERLKNL